MSGGIDKSKADFKFLQVFGDKISLEKVSEEDIISALQFDQTGRCLQQVPIAGRSGGPSDFVRRIGLTQGQVRGVPVFD
jgi:hypothetical protein